MKALRSKWTRIGLALALIVVLAVSLACGSDEPKGPIVLVEQDWDGSLVTTAVAQILLEQEMGYTVEYLFATASSAPQYIGLESGEYHFVCCDWPSYSAALLDEYVHEGGKMSVERLGDTGIKGQSGIYVPRYVVEGDEARGIAAAAPNLSSYEDLNQYKDIFASADTGDKGRVVDTTPAWDSRSPERLEAYGVEYAVVYSGSETATISELDGAFQRGDPIIVVLWEPHWAHAKYDLIPLVLPEWNEDCYPTGDSFNCGYPAEPVAKLVWPGLKDQFPEVYEFLSNFTITNQQQSEMVLNVTDNEVSHAEAAQAWVDANEDIWKEWIP